MISKRAFVPVLLLCALSGCARKSEQSVEASRQVQVPTVKVSLSREQSLQQTLEVSGNLIGNDEVIVSSQVEGVARRVLRDLGDAVGRGTVLAELDSTEFDIQVQRAEASYREALARLGVPAGSTQIPPIDSASEVRQAKAQLEDANTKVQRQESLLQRGVVSQQIVDDARTTQKVAAARYQSAVENVQNMIASAQQFRAALDWARKKARDTTVLSPIAGIVQEKLVSTGEYVKVNQPLFKLVSVHVLKLRAQIMERDARLIRPGMKVELTVDAFPDLHFSGTINRIAPAVDEKSRTFAIEALVPNTGALLKPGFFARCVIPVGTYPAILVPEQSILSLAGLKKAYVVQDSVARERTLQVGRAVNDWVEVKSGIQPHEYVALNNQQMLSDGQKVKVERD
jgi:RND family efflux transporter MFP subunit